MAVFFVINGHKSIECTNLPIVKSCVRVVAYLQFLNFFGAGFYSSVAFMRRRLICNVLSLQNS